MNHIWQALIELIDSKIFGSDLSKKPKEHEIQLFFLQSLTKVRIFF